MKASRQKRKDLDDFSKEALARYIAEHCLFPSTIMLLEEIEEELVCAECAAKSKSLGEKYDKLLNDIWGRDGPERVRLLNEMDRLEKQIRRNFMRWDKALKSMSPKSTAGGAR